MTFAEWHKDYLLESCSPKQGKGLEMIIITIATIIAWELVIATFAFLSKVIPLKNYYRKRVKVQITLLGIASLLGAFVWLFIKVAPDLLLSDESLWDTELAGVMFFLYFLLFVASVYRYFLEKNITKKELKERDELLYGKDESRSFNTIKRILYGIAAIDACMIVIYFSQLSIFDMDLVGRLAGGLSMILFGAALLGLLITESGLGVKLLRLLSWLSILAGIIKIFFK